MKSFLKSCADDDTGFRDGPNFTIKYFGRENAKFDMIFGRY